MGRIVTWLGNLPNMSLQPGEVFAGYTVVRALDSDAMGETYLADLPQPPRRDVLRLLPATLSADVAFRARFELEASLAAGLWHPHVVGVHGHGEQDGRLWIATDFVDGTDAARLLRDRYPAGMPADEALEIVTAVADALDYAHARTVVHGDVEAASILLVTSPRPRILLTGFGIPRVGNEDRADQYDLAATAYHLLTGSRVLGERPDLDPAIERALSEDPERRFDSCLAFAASLRALLTGVADPAASTIAWAQSPPLPTERFESTAPASDLPAVFVPAWSAEQPALEPYLDEYVTDPNAGESSAPTMARMAVPEVATTGESEALVLEPSSQGPAGRTWALLAVAAAVVLTVVAAIVVFARSGPEPQAQPSGPPAISSSTAPPPASPAAEPPPSAPPPSAAPPGAARERVKPPVIAGLDGRGEDCSGGYQITGQTGWASQGVRGSPEATCVFVGNVLKAYWDAADPGDAPRSVVAAGGIPCSEGAECAGDAFVVACGVEGSDPWVTCRGGRGAVVLLY